MSEEPAMYGSPRTLINFYHANIIKYCNRPWLEEGDLDDDGRWVSDEIKNLRAEQMTEAMIENWNGVVRPKDRVYHVGDFALVRGPRSKDLVSQLVKRLNGQIHLILGNHDEEWLRQIRGFAWVGHQYQGKMVKIGDQRIFLFHTACRIWDRSHHGAWHFYGHSHSRLPEDLRSLSFDIGVDARNFTPLASEQAKEEMELKISRIANPHQRRDPTFRCL